MISVVVLSSSLPWPRDASRRAPKQESALGDERDALVGRQLGVASGAAAATAAADRGAGAAMAIGAYPWR